MLNVGFSAYSSYMKPFSGGIFQSRSLRTKNFDNKVQYNKLWKISDDFSEYSIPERFLDYGNSNKISRIMNPSRKSQTLSSKTCLFAKNTIKKVLDYPENDPDNIKNSGYKTNVLIVNPPSPKPDITVAPVNSLKEFIDNFEQSKPAWLENLIIRHQRLIDERKEEIECFRKSSEKYGEVNKDMRMDEMNCRINKSLKIADAVLDKEEIIEAVEMFQLTEAQLLMVNEVFIGDPNEVIIEKFKLSITRRDFLTLADPNWLNDEVINFYMNMIIERGEHPKWPKTYAFNTFFYPKLLKDGYQSLKRWTKKVDIFNYALICIPIHLGLHWCLAVIDLRTKYIRYYDSNGNSNNRCLEALKNYLEAEHLDKKKIPLYTSDFKLENTKDIPQQSNGNDCGVFICAYAEFITRDARIGFSQDHIPYLRNKVAVELLNGELLVK